MIYLEILNGIYLGILLSRWHDSLMMKIYPILRKSRKYVRTYRLTISDFPYFSINRWDIIEIKTASLQASFFLGDLTLLRAHISLNFRKSFRFLKKYKESPSKYMIYFLRWIYIYLQVIMSRWFSTENEDRKTRFGNIMKKLEPWVLSSLAAST